MGRFAPKYTDEQRVAATARVVDDGLMPADVVSEASAGTLSGLAPFELNLHSVRAWASQERRRRRGDELSQAIANGDPHEIVDATTRRILGMVEHLIAGFERGIQQGRDPSWRELTDATTALIKARSLVQPLTRDGQPQRSKEPGKVGSGAATETVEKLVRGLPTHEQGNGNGQAKPVRNRQVEQALAERARERRERGSQ